MEGCRGYKVLILSYFILSCLLSYLIKVLIGNNNTESVIGDELERADEAVYIPTPGILSGTEYRSFWVLIFSYLIISYHILSGHSGSAWARATPTPSAWAGAGRRSPSSPRHSDTNIQFTTQPLEPLLMWTALCSGLSRRGKMISISPPKRTTYINTSDTTATINEMKHYLLL